MNKSPFPGMDPYLEQFWGDVHSRFVVYMADQINDQLPGDLQARVEEGLMVDTETYSRRIYPDVQVVDRPEVSFPPGTPESGTAVAEPCVVVLPHELRTERHIEIIDRNSGNRVVTAIELLSPANKRKGPGRDAYEQKQREYINAGVNLVEIDLIRQGSFVVAIPEVIVPKYCRTTYIICVRRANRQSEVELFPVPLQEPLPNIAIPLRPTDADIVLQLQPLLDVCYRRGRYALLDYTRPLNPSLDNDDQAWTDQLLRSSGTRD
ncbi:MAG: DUF4058 family protein [Planctomycetaceae bacterium]|nr:DUF4058 family protein [Planctomycetaceae bacterium]